MCFSFEGRYANHQHRHTDEKKKSGRAPYWFVSPFNNISVLIDTKEEKIRIFILSAETKEDKTLDNKPNISVG
jgi:hypothetical protein